MAQERGRKTFYPWQCTRCDVLGDQDEVIQHHLETHVTADEIPFACKDCPFKTFTRGKAKEHRLAKHGGNESENIDNVFLGTKTNINPSKLRTTKSVNRRETFKMTWDDPKGYRSARVYRYGDRPWNKWFRGRAFKYQGNRSSPPLRGNRFVDPYREKSVMNLRIRMGETDQTRSSDRRVVMDQGDHRRSSSEGHRGAPEHGNKVLEPSRGEKRRHDKEETKSNGKQSKRDEDLKKPSRRGQPERTKGGQKSDGKEHEMEGADKADSSEKSSKSLPEKSKTSSKPSGVRDKVESNWRKSDSTASKSMDTRGKISGEVESDRKKEKKKRSLPGEPKKKAEDKSSGKELEVVNLLKTPSTSSLCDEIMEAADCQQQTEARHHPSPSSVIAEESRRKESRASSICSMQSATSCGPSHSLMIAGPDGSMREVDRSKQTTRSECGSMCMISSQKNPFEAGGTTTVLPVAVQFERVRARVRNIDENLARSCEASQVTAKGMERILEEMRQLKSSIRDLNGIQTETNVLLKRQQLTLDSIRKSCEQQLEIKKLKLQLHHAVSDTSKHMVEEFLCAMGGGEEDAYGDDDHIEEDNGHEGSIDEGVNDGKCGDREESDGGCAEDKMDNARN